MRTTIADSRFEIRESRPGTGLGLFANVPIKKGDFILEYTGEKIPNAVADTMPGRYLFELDDTWTIDGEGEENTARYINHDCYPNTEADIENGKINIYAIEKIPVGAELTIDYGDEYFDEFIRPGGCKCASCESGKKSPHDK